MCRFPIVSAAVLLCCSAMSAAGESGRPGDQIATDNGVLTIHPVNHATFVMQWNGKTVYVDPVGGVKPFANLPKPDLVLVTHAHFDHFDAATLKALVPAGGHIVVVAAKTVAENIPETLRGKITVKVLGCGGDARQPNVGRYRHGDHVPPGHRRHRRPCPGGSTPHRR